MELTPVFVKRNVVKIDSLTSAFVSYFKFTIENCIKHLLWQQKQKELPV